MKPLLPLLNLCFALGACGRLTPHPERQGAPAERTAVAATPPPGPAAPKPGFLGVVLAPATVDLASQLESRLEHLRVRPGDRVTRGEILARLDTRTARKELAMARASVLAAKADVQRAVLELAQAGERVQRRSTSVELPSGTTVGTVSQEEASNAGYQEKLAAAHLDAAKAAVMDKQAHCDELRALAEEGAVRSPFDAIVSQRYVDEGTILRKGTPIVRLIESSELRVRFAVPEDRARSIEIAVPVRIRVDELELSGVVEKIAPEIDAAARMIFVDASLSVPEKDKSHVRSGQVARVFTIDDAEHAQR